MPTDNNPPDLPAVIAATGEKAFMLAFILADGNSCDAAWDGTSPVSPDSAVANVINRVRNAGGNGTGAQSWTATSDGTLRAVGNCLDANGQGTANGTKIQIWDCNGGGNPVWQSYNGGYRNPASGRCLDDPGATSTNGTQLQLYDCNGTNAQQWSAPGA